MIEHVGSTSVYIGTNLLETSLLQNICTNLNKNIAIITDTNIAPSYADFIHNTLIEHEIHASVLSFSAIESNKTRESKQQLEDQLLNMRYGRDTCLIAVGGGIVTDLVGFLAATYCRGVPVIYIPTTLLAMVDASVGGKTGVNTAFGKNLVGTITQPYAVLMDMHTLQTLPDREWRNGIAEIIKHSLIADAQLFGVIEQLGNLALFKNAANLRDLIQQNILIKKNITEQDEHENGLRQLLNFGHTIGHAIEIIEDYKISHGEAVALGMLIECYVSTQMGYLPTEVLAKLYKLLENYQLPLKTIAFQNKSIFLNALKLDKKSIKSIPRFVLLKNIGQPYQQAKQYTWPVDLQLLDQALDWAAIQFG